MQRTLLRIMVIALTVFVFVIWLIVRVGGWVGRTVTGGGHGPQITALKILEAVGDLSLTELSERMSARNSTITGIVDWMERDGLVVCERS